MSSDGILVIDHRSPSLFESNSWISSFRRRNGPPSGPFDSSRLILLLKWELWMILFSAEAILASSTSKFGIEKPRIDDEDLNSSTESTNSTSLIHCIASVGNCEQIHTSVLNLIFQHAKVAGVGNLSKWRSEICSPLLVLHHNSLKNLLHWRWLNFWLTVQTGISDLDFVLAFHFFSTVDEWSGSSIDEFHWCNSWG